MRELILKKGKKAFIDDEDYERVKNYRYRWVFSSKAPIPYIFSKCYKNGKNKKWTISLHRFILKLTPEDKVHVDHKDGNVFNNQKSNLRICTRSQNNANRKPYSRSGFKGVYWHKTAKKWRVNITIDGKVKTIGNFEQKEKAARAYDSIAEKVFGEFAHLNFKRKMTYAKGQIRAGKSTQFRLQGSSPGFGGRAGGIGSDDALNGRR